MTITLDREEKLTICEERDGTVVPTREGAAAGSFWVPPWVVHGTLNLSAGAARFQTIGQPGLMSGYFAEAGVRVADAGEAPPSWPRSPRGGGSGSGGARSAAERRAAQRRTR